ncbi:MAG: YidC/Oxa1 family membrane protein insertase [Clostridia bacterium]|nr:YidC/Oxa1 family membrane protein insertase [Clostridia bacterium]
MGSLSELVAKTGIDNPIPGFSYVLAIVLLTIIIKTILYPLTLKQMKSMTMMQQLAPELKKIQDRYKGKDPQKLQQKTMELYQKYNVNPLAGCIPLIIQMPILIALYQALRNYFEDSQAGFLWIKSLGGIGWDQGDPYFVIPILAAGSTFLQSKMTMVNQDKNQKMMVYLMPFFILWLVAAVVPVGLGIYWIVFNLVGIAQQHFVNKHTTELKDLMAELAEKEEKERKKRQEKAKAPKESASSGR